MPLAVTVGRVSGCVLILFRTTCGSGWLRCCRVLPSAVTAVPGDCVFPTGWASLASKPFDPWVLRAKVSVFVELYDKGRQLQEQAALMLLQLESGDGKSAVGQAKKPTGLLAELSARLQAVEETAEALSKRLNDMSAAPGPVAAATHLEHKLTGLRRALDALEPGAGEGHHRCRHRTERLRGLAVWGSAPVERRRLGISGVGALTWWSRASASCARRGGVRRRSLPRNSPPPGLLSSHPPKR